MRKQRLLEVVGLVVFLTFAMALTFSPAMAQTVKEDCDNGQDEDGDKLVDCEDPDCTLDPACAGKVICHNIGGPRDLGANCDMTGTCTYTAGTGQAITLPEDGFLGIIIGFNQNSAGALAAHLAHGDGFIISTFDPPLHLASTDGPHRDSNVECLAIREVPQPNEPGN
jgi:hypothetical protein